MGDKKKNLKVEDLVLGKGRVVKNGDTIVVHYTGRLEDGTQFDSSYDHNQPFETKIGVGYVIRGWDRGIIGMKAGGKRKLIIPYDLGYGKYGTEGIPGFATLIFEIDLIKII